jgi:hypothetical protein
LVKGMSKGFSCHKRECFVPKIFWAPCHTKNRIGLAITYFFIWLFALATHEALGSLNGLHTHSFS